MSTAANDGTGESDRLALVTGGAGALGSSVAARFAADGSRVVLVDVERAAVEGAAERIVAATGADVVGWTGDVSSDAANRALVDRVTHTYGRLDRLVNCAALPQRARFGDLAYDEWRSVLDVNLWGPASLCQAAAPLWRETGYGRVVNIASRTWQSGGPLAYVASKAGLVGLTRALAVELGPLSVTVNAVAPSVVETEFIRSGRSAEQYEELMAHHRRLPHLPRLASVADVVHAVAYLCSPGAGFVTGEVLHVAGGAQLAPAP